ncbi:HNH endonuclease [Paenibacillus sp. VCA1]|uniref:HNH endonuclease n=1 Tax=Paenibacillus sp. VCA1 TaxID=3039148 RepID=UPI0028714366|nr:HNH endonuclease [Paenibacillus sp. VCA1]MDR9857860.1 HNH endonuclease [Paenibacillus sp. VCA1]
MPSKARRPCSYPGCPALTSEGSRCNEHRRAVDRSRGTAAERGYDGKWRKARAEYLRNHPLCKHCQDNNKLTEATRVDHIIPHKGNRQLFWDRNNWQPLCESCHNRKTAKEDGGFGNG